MTEAQIIYNQILDMDSKSIPYTGYEKLNERKLLIGQLNKLGFTVGLGKGHKVVLKEMPKHNPLEPQKDNF